MQIVNGRLRGAKFLAANSSGGALVPELIVVHDTAGRLESGSSVDWFRSKQCKTSAHVVVERDGTIVQMVPFNRKAFHAGASQWGGRRFCNGFAIGIEIVSPGKLDANGKAWFSAIDRALVPTLVQKSTPEHGTGWWLPYTPQQIEAVQQLCRAIIAEYPDCNEIVTHWMISPGRKIDTSPVFPLEDVRAYAVGDTAPDAEADVPAVPVALIADVPASSVTAKSIAADGSRSMSWLLSLRAWLVRSGAAIGTYFGLDTFGSAKGTLHEFKALVADHAMLILLGIVGLALAGVLVVQHFYVQAARDGRYVPQSGEK